MGIVTTEAAEPCAFLQGGLREKCFSTGARIVCVTDNLY
jgi:hypothetical protein